MGIKSSILYIDSSVNPQVGCNGCELYHSVPALNHCYAATLVRRFPDSSHWPSDFTVPEYYPYRLEKAIRWSDLTGKPRPDKPWLDGYPRIIFVNDLSDGFCPDADPDIWLTPYLPVMAASPHIYLLLTKWPSMMHTYFKRRWKYRVPPNFWLGTSVLTQKDMWRVDWLIQIQAAIRWLSIEPLLEQDKLDYTDVPAWDWRYTHDYYKASFPGVGPVLNWVAVGGESGTNGRPMSPEVLDKLIVLGAEAKVPTFMKQWGTWKPVWDSKVSDSGYTMMRGSSKENGRTVHGKEYSQMPPLDKVMRLMNA